MNNKGTKQRWSKFEDEDEGSGRKEEKAAQRQARIICRGASIKATVVIRPYAGDAGKMPRLDPAKLSNGRFHGKNFKCDTAFTQKLAESIAAASNALDLQTA